jgi:hypothetical protein
MPIVTAVKKNTPSTVLRRSIAWLLAACAAICLPACERRPPAQAFFSYVAALESVDAAVASATGYPPDHIDVSGNRTHLYITLIAPALMAADDATLEKAATEVVAAAAPLLAQHTEFAALMTINVEIYHPSGLATVPNKWHTQNALEFRRGPDRRFAIQAP